MSMNESAVLQQSLTPLLKSKQTTMLGSPSKTISPSVKKESIIPAEPPEPKKPQTFLALERLELEAIQLTSEHLKLLMPLIEHSRSLTYLNLSYNAIGSSALEAFLQRAMENDSIKHLNLSHMNIGHPLCQRMLKSYVKHSWSLVNLNLSYT